MPYQSGHADLYQPNPGEAAEDLPPHRAAIPVNPSFIAAEALSRRRNTIMLGVVFSVALHVGFVAAAFLWGQGGALPESALPAAIRVEVQDVSLHESAAAREALLGDHAVRAEAEDLAALQDEAMPPAMPDPEQEAEPVTAGQGTGEKNEGAAHTPAVETQAPAAEQPASGAALDNPVAPASPPLQAQAARQALTAEEQEKLDLAIEPDLPEAAVTEEETETAPPIPQRADKPAAENGATASFGDGYLPQALPSRRAGASRGAMFGYKRRVRARILRNLPVNASGPGRVVIGFRVTRSGSVASAFVLRSSGNAAIDRAALATVRSSAPYPAPPRAAKPAQLALSIDFRFE